MPDRANQACVNERAGTIARALLFSELDQSVGEFTRFLDEAGDRAARGRCASPVGAAIVAVAAIEALRDALMQLAAIAHVENDLVELDIRRGAVANPLGLQNLVPLCGYDEVDVGWRKRRNARRS